MPRQALLVANTIDFEGRSGDQSRGVVERLLQRFSAILSTEVPQQHRFTTRAMLDATPSQVRDALENQAGKARASNDLLLFYYFGHGHLNRDYNLQLVYPGENRGDVRFQLLSTLEGIVKEAEVHHSLFVIDCCYAGAVARTFATTLSGEHCRMASTTPASRAYVDIGRAEDPIGYFSRAFMDGFIARDACEPVSNTISAQSLFRYAKRRTKEESGGIQLPTMTGQLAEALAEFTVRPPTLVGIAADANAKTGYKKLLSLILPLSKFGGQESIDDLRRLVVRDYPESFKTLHKQADGRFTYLPVRHQVISRYVRFLRKLHLVLPEELALTPSGKALAKRADNRFSEDLLEVIDQFLRRHGLERSTIEKAPQEILAHRGVPTQQQIIDYLSLAGGRASRDDLGIVLTVLGCCRALRVSETTAYFSW